jgi:hypothetical protein
MCQYFSCVIDRNFKVYWSPRTISHEDVIAENKLKDDKLEDRDIVRIEISPKSYDNLTRNKEDWVYKVDEEKTIPEWYVKNQKKAEKKCWDAWAESVKVNLALGKEKTTIKNSFAIASGNSTVKAWGNSTVEAWDNSTVKASGNSTVKASGNSTVEASGNSTVKAFSKSVVRAYSKTAKLCSEDAVVFYPLENRLEVSKKMKVDVVKVEVKP